MRVKVRFRVRVRLKASVRLIASAASEHMSARGDNQGTYLAQ